MRLRVTQKSLQLPFLLLFLFLVSAFRQTAKSFLKTFYDSLPMKRVAKIGRISLDTSKKLCVTNVFEDVICDACDPCNATCFALPYSR